jgi:hypothetical protein
MKGFFFVLGDEFLTFCEKYFLNSQKLILKKECQKKEKKKRKKKLGRNF